MEVDVKTMLRVGLIILAVCWSVVAKMIANRIGNKKLSEMATRVFIAFVMIVIFRIIAAIIDAKLEFEVGVFSAMVTYGFNCYILYLLLKFYFKLREDEVAFHKTDGNPVLNPSYINKSELSHTVDEMWRILKININKTDKVLSDLRKIQ